MKQKSPQASSQGDRTFDFKYKLDISDRKGKTGQTFKQQSGFEFQDFKDFRQDKTMKSQINSQKKWLPSELVKKSEQSLIITQNATELSVRKKGGSFMVQNLKQQNFQGDNQQMHTLNYVSSPKFNEQKPYQTSSPSMDLSKNKQQLFKQKAKLNSKFSMPVDIKLNQNFQYQTSKQGQKSSQKFLSPKFNFNNTNKTSFNVSSSRNRITQQSPQIQFKDLLSSIQFISSQNQKLDYQTYKILQQIAQYEQLLEENPGHQYEIQKLTAETNQINEQISNHRSLERTLIDSKKKLEEDFDEIMGGVQAMKFNRPAVMKDQTKAIVDQINSLKTQLEALRRDEGSLNLSLTLMNPNSIPPTSLQNRLNPFPIPSSSGFSPEQILMKQYLQQILIASSNQPQAQPNYIYNIKMMTMKDEWKMYEDAELCVSCSTRQYPIMEVRIGNKTGKNLTQFKLKEGAGLIAERQVLQAKSYYIHCLRMTQISQPFSKIQISYKTNKISLAPSEAIQIKQTTLYLPLLPLKHGEFLPITAKQYINQTNQHKNNLQQITSFEKPVDNSIIKQKLQQLLLYFPNFIYEIDKHTGAEICKGIFRIWNSVDGALVQIFMRDGRITIKVKNNIVFFLQSLEFLLAIQV